MCTNSAMAPKSKRPGSSSSSNIYIYEFLVNIDKVMYLLLPRGIDLITELGSLDIAFAKTLALVRAPANLNTIVHIEPFRMMIVFFGMQGNLAHKPEGRHKVIELKYFPDGFL